MKTFSQTLKVRSYELDAQGHVNYAVYLSYLEYARVATMQQLGLPFEHYFQKGTHGLSGVRTERTLAPLSRHLVGAYVLSRSLLFTGHKTNDIP